MSSTEDGGTTEKNKYRVLDEVTDTYIYILCVIQNLEGIGVDCGRHGLQLGIQC